MINSFYDSVRSNPESCFISSFVIWECSLLFSLSLFWLTRWSPFNCNPHVRFLASKFLCLTFVVEQMHMAAFVLPTFAKRELEAYCASTETVSFLFLFSFYKSGQVIISSPASVVFAHKQTSYWENLCPVLQEQAEEVAATAPKKLTAAPKRGITTAS